MGTHEHRTSVVQMPRAEYDEIIHKLLALRLNETLHEGVHIGRAVKRLDLGAGSVQCPVQRSYWGIRTLAAVGPR